jgi:hypothetical protein
VKKWLFLFLLLPVLFVSQTQTLAPELYSYGIGYGVKTDSAEAYIIHSQWDEEEFLFLMYGKRNGDFFDGRIVQIAGEHIGSYAPYDCSSEFVYCYRRQDKNNWRGWIEFRGHTRPFCGGDKIKSPCIKIGD